MEFSLKFLLSAETDIQIATDFYANISKKVLKNFNQKLDEAFLKLEYNPYFQLKI